MAGNLEADDLAARLRRFHVARGREVMLVTSDADWLQLVGPGVTMLQLRRHTGDQVRVTDRNFAEHVGLPHPKALAEAKALMGDTSDSIPGVGGIGEKTAYGLLNIYGSVTGFTNAMMSDPESRKIADKRALKLLDDEERMIAFQRNMRLIWLDHPEAPPSERPNHVKGRFDADAFARMAEECAFTSILRDFDRWIAPFKEGR